MKQSAFSTESQQWLCPDLSAYWQLGNVPGSKQVVLQALDSDRQFVLSALEGSALRYFSGQFTVGQVQAVCQQSNETIASDFVLALLQKLITLDILALPAADSGAIPVSSGFALKTGVTWIEHPAGYWLLRNPHDATFLQLSADSKVIVEQLGERSPDDVIQRYNLNPASLHQLLRLLAVTGMLRGTTLPQPPPRKFNPLHLLFFRIPLVNPDAWLTQHVDKLRWLWTRSFGLLLSSFLAATSVLGFADRLAWLAAGQQLWHYHGTTLLLPFILLCILVVSLHELGHAFTLKHYGGVVPEIGLLLMCLMPGCYTNTTDSYCLVKRRQRALVVGAGLLCQLTLWASAFWVWQLSVPGTWLFTTSYLLMAAALLTVAVNLNPLAKFDGYYLAVALSGINNLRSRSFGFYAHLLRRQPTHERAQDAWVLAVYAPFSLAYTLFVFGHLLLWLGSWCFTHIPTLTLLLLSAWLVYFYVPRATAKAA